MTTRRIVALGASNLTRGLHAVVAGARGAWGADVEVLAALGHGRSYGATSFFLVRSLPGILASGLWRELERRPRVPTRALVTDVGNDVAYGYGAARTLGWIEETLDRLAPFADEVVITDLPLDRLRRLSHGEFLAFRTLFVPHCRLPLERVLEDAQAVSDGLAALAERRGLRLVRLRPEWYGIDPIHIRPWLWSRAWREILLAEGERDRDGPPVAWREALRLYLLPPERQRLLGFERAAPQRGRPLPHGGLVWLY